MKKLSFLLVAMLGLTIFVHAQKATINITIKNTTDKNCYFSIPAKWLSRDYLNLSRKTIDLTGDKGSVSVNLRQPVFAYLMYSDGGGSSKARRYGYKFYLSPGYHLKFVADAANGNVKVSGIGSNNNQPLLGKTTNPEIQKLYGDTLANRIIAVANTQRRQLESAYRQYVKNYAPSTDFKQAQLEEIKYAALETYFDFKENNKFQIGGAYERNKPLWQKIQDSLMKQVKLNNSNALVATNYQSFLREFLLREKERLWQESQEHPAEFYKEYYNADIPTGTNLFVADNENLLTEKIINKHFTGAVAETAYAILIDEALDEKNPKNLVSIYDRFGKKYPDSEYRLLFKKEIDKVRKAEKKSLTSDMVFLPQNGSNLKNFEEILTLAKGKTVLLDMWGTWCGPCREEISKHSAAIKDHFKDKGLDYFYVANSDLDHVNEWKKLIAFFDMKGTHVLASPELDKDIMHTVKGTGYPTYVIIKKDGTWELSKAGYPMKRDVLIKQLEAALAM